MFSNKRVIRSCRTSRFLSLSPNYITTVKLQTLSLRPCQRQVTALTSDPTTSRYASTLLNARGLAVKCGNGSNFAHTVPSLQFHTNRVAKLVNGGNYNGAALIHALAKLVGPISNHVRLGNIPTGPHSLAHTKFLIVRSIGCRLFSSDIHRRLLVKLSRASTNVATRTGRIVTSLSLTTFIRQRPVDLSNKRGRQITVNSTLVYNGSLVVLSRPADKLSHCRVRRINRLLQRLTDRNGTVLIIARSRRLTTN